jgi:hypothetical protein
MVCPSMLASFPASMVNQKSTDLGIPDRFSLNSSRSSRVREAKTDLMATLAIRKDHTEVQQERIGSPLRPQLKDQTFEANIVDWLDQHPAPSPPGRCARCGRPESHSAVVLPFGTEPGTHTWLHAECWPGWHQARRAEAIAALRAISIRIGAPKSKGSPRRTDRSLSQARREAPYSTGWP